MFLELMHTTSAIAPPKLESSCPLVFQLVDRSGLRVRPDMAAPSDGLLEARAVGDTGDARALKRRRDRAIEISQCMKELATAHGGPKRERDGSSPRDPPQYTIELLRCRVASYIL